MTLPYRHTQIGYALIAALGAGMFAVARATTILGSLSAPLWIAAALMGVALLLLPSLTTVVDAQGVRCYFGVGLIRRSVPMAEIAEVSIVRPHWLYGWGVRLIPGGWLWRVSGLSAVQLRLRSGKLFQIGTDDAQGLSGAIARRLSRAEDEAVD
jgi:hypothetical protein